MKIYLVGGAIRDKLLGISVKEKDWVVVGSTPEEMHKKGYKQVGKDFPVFIDTKTGEEYALARTERKSGHGYTGFEFDANPNVTLEEDLARRDLTINAIAQDEDGTLIDPFNGQEDIKNMKLRHVSDAFSEDPLRVLRVARFKTNSSFEIAEETIEKIHEVIDSGEMEHLTGERIWLELYKSEEPWGFAEILEEFEISELLPSYNAEKANVPYEIPREVVNDNLLNLSLFMYLCIDDVEKFCEKLKTPNEYKELALLLSKCKDIYDYEPSLDVIDSIMNIIKRLDIRKEERLKNFFKLSLGFTLHTDEKEEFFKSLITKIKNFKLKDEDQKKSNQEIQKIREHSHLEIAQKHIKEYLDSK